MEASQLLEPPQLSDGRQHGSLAIGRRSSIDADKGISHLERLERAHPELEFVAVAFGDAYAEKKLFTNAETQLRRALQLKPDNLQAKDSLALTLLALGEQGEAESLLAELTKSEPTAPQIFYQLGKVQFDRGETKDAIASLEIAARLAPQDNAIRQELARAGGAGGADITKK